MCLAGKAVEAAWRARHKAAAQRLAVYCSDLPAKPPLAPVVHLASFCSIAAGLAFDGQGLCGQLPSAFADPTGPLALQHSSWGPGARNGRGQGRSSGVQLLVSGSVAGRGTPEVHEAAGLSRAQLLELFTGTTADPVAGAAAVAAAGAAAGADAVGPGGIQEVAAPAAAAAGPRPAFDAAALPGVPVGQSGAAAESPAPGLDSLRVSTDSGSEKSVDAVIRIKQPAQGRGKPVAAGSHSSGPISRVTAPISRTVSNASSSSAVSGPVMVVGADSTPAAAAATAEGEVVARPADPLAFLDSLPLYGQQDHAHVLAEEAEAAVAAAAEGSGESVGDSSLVLAVPAHASGSKQQIDLYHGLQLALRGAYLLVVFAPFLLFGAPMLLISWWLLTRAAAAQQHQVTPSKPQADSSSTSWEGEDSSSSSTVSRFGVMGARIRQALMQHPQELAMQLLQRLWQGLLVLFALVDLVLVLMLGGHWAAGVSAWESAGMWLRRKAWVLLHFSCSHAGAAFIKWGQWSSSRRDIFPADFCDALSLFHDK